MALAGQRGYRMLEGRALTALADLHRVTGDPVSAVRTAEAALANQRAGGYRLFELRTLAILAVTVDDPEAARDYRRAAVDLATGMGAPVPVELTAADPSPCG